MRLLLPLLAAPLLGAAPPTPSVPATPPSATDSRDCRLLTETGDKGTVRLRRLGELPPGEAYAAVWRVDERGCPLPLKYEDR